MHLSHRGLLAALILATARAASAQQETPPPSAETPSQAPAAEAGSPVASEPVTEAAGKRSATEEIVVTGSRIRRKDLTTPAPVTVISRDQVQASGKVSIGDFLQTIPEQGNSTNTAVNNGGDGTVNVALRSLGQNRTLVLGDGKRMVFGAGGNGGTLASAVDLNAIPISAIERVEILKDGASSLYGSDAIAGVVNIITRKKANGTEVSGYTGTSSRGGGTAYDLSLTTGASGDTGNFIFTGGYFNQNEIFAGQRGWAQNAVAYNF